MTDTSVEVIKERLDIVDVIGSYIELQKEGSRYKANCPFHDDRTPSLKVFPDTGTWHCFGACDDGGDIFDFVMKREGLEFREALVELAQQAGVSLEISAEEKQQIARRRERAAVFAAAMEHFRRLFGESDAAKAYCRQRGWTTEAVMGAGLGFYDGNRQGLRAALEQAEIDVESPAARALLVGIPDDEIKPMPANVLVYPHVWKGRTTYISARAINGKFHWNPPKALVGAKQPFWNHEYGRSAEMVAVCEGQADAVTLGQWGLAAVALAGTAVADGSHPANDAGSSLDSQSSSDNLILSVLNRESTTIVLALDADEAGQEASEKLAEAMLARGCSPLRIRRVAWPGEASDANEWMQTGATEEDVLLLIERAPNWLDILVGRTNAAPERKRGVHLRRVFEALTGLDRFEVTRLRNDLAERLDINRSEFDSFLRSARKDAGQDEKGREKYLVSAGRIWHQHWNSNGEKNAEPLCNFTAEIEKDVLRDNGLEVNREFVIGGEVGGRRMPKANVPANDFYKMDWVLREWGSGAIIEAGGRTRDHLRAAVQHLSKDVERQTVYTHTGWREVEGEMVYLSHGGGVGCNGNIAVELDQDLQLYEVPAEPDEPMEAMMLSLDTLMVAPEHVTWPLWGAMFAAPLRGFDINLAFCLWLYGSTGTMKSTLAALMCNHFGEEFNDKNLPANFEDSANRLEHKSFVVKDAPFVIDDFAPQKNRRSYNKYEYAAHRIVRGVGNQSGRGRLNADSTAKLTYTPRSLPIITGEDIPETQSIVARLFVLEMSPDDVDIQALSEMQEQRHRLPHAMAGYVRWLAKRWDELEEDVPRLWRKCRRKAWGSGGHKRIAEALAGLFLGIHYGLSYAKDVGAVDASEYEDLRERGWQALLASCNAMDQRIVQEKPELLYIQTIDALLTQGKVFFKPKDEITDAMVPLSPTDEDGAAKRGEFLGWYDKDFVYLLPDPAYTTVSKHFRDQGNVFPVRKNTLHKMLVEAGLVVPHPDDEKNRIPRSLWADGRSHWCLYMKRSVFDGDRDGNDEF